MAKPRLQTLKPRLASAAQSRVSAVADRAGSTKRTRGSQLVKRRAAWLREHPLCVACKAQGRVSAATELDHVTPLWAGGADDDTNFQGLCHDCHATKTADEARQRSAG